MSPLPIGLEVGTEAFFVAIPEAIHFDSLVCHTMVFGRREHWVIAGVQLHRAAAWEALQAHSFLSYINWWNFTVCASVQDVALRATKW